MNLQEYYAYAYNLLCDSNESDSLYKMEQNKPVYRMDHQAETFAKRVPLPPGARVLEYGCAKAGTLERLTRNHPEMVPFAFDISDAYRAFWRRFIPDEQAASFTTPDHWNGTMDVVMSYFVLEHVSDIHGVIQHMKRLLKPDGILYAIVPDCLVNIADLVVVDHVNHFTIPSLIETLRQNDLMLMDLDTTGHDGAFILVAKACSQEAEVQDLTGFPTCQEIEVQVGSLAKYWKDLSSKIQSFETSQSSKMRDGQHAAIYGSGFYGTYIATCLQDLESVKCFIDQNPYRHTESLMSKPIVAPETVGLDIQWVYVGLRPEIAQQNIQAIEAWQNVPRDYFYL